MPDLEALGRERAELQKQLDALQPSVKVAAVQAVLAGGEKMQVAKTAAVSRPTLDKWVNEALFDRVIAGRDEGSAIIEPDIFGRITGDLPSEVTRIAKLRGLESSFENHQNGPRLSWRKIR